MRRLRSVSCRRHAVTALFAMLVLASLCTAQDAAPEGEAKPPELAPAAKFVTLTSPVDDQLSSRVQTAARSLQKQAEQENRRAVLVLQMTPGSSQFHQIQGLARFLTSAELSRVTTVAWVPETVTGNNVVLALACKEIIMHPDAELGDIGRGKPLEAIDQQFVLSLAEKRYNRMLSPALVRGLMDPRQVVLRIQKQIGPPENKETEWEVVTPDELKRLVDTGAVVLDRETVLDVGSGKLSGAKARALEILVVQTAATLREVAQIYHIPTESMRENAVEGTEIRARLIEVHDIIEPKMASLVQRQIHRAVEQGVNLLVFDINSGGGYLQTSQDLAYTISFLDPKQVRTVAYIDKQAMSGAAIVALGCDEIYMTPEAQIGDAGPIEIREGQWFERAPEKVLSSLRQTLQTLAERKERPAALAVAMADRNYEVFRVTHRDTGRVWYMAQHEIDAADGEWTRHELVPESKKDLLLTVTGKRAHELKLAAEPVANRDELKAAIGIPPDMELAAAPRVWVDGLIDFLNTGTALGLLITIGVVCIVVEVHFMTGILGIISATCFALVFWSRFMGGTAGWLEIMLFVLGLACIALEIFVIPGFGVFGISGGVLILVSLVMASQTFEMSTDGSGNASHMADTLKTLSASAVIVAVLLMALNRFLPRIPLFSQMVLAPPGGAYDDEAAAPRLRSNVLHAAGQGHSTAAALVGAKGETISILRPAGKANFGGKIVDVVSNGPYIEKGSAIEVIEVAGNRIVVREA